MAESATDVIVARSSRREPMAPMVAGSVAVHVVVLALVVFVTMVGRAEEPVREVMMITLSGSPGPNSGGMTQIGDRAVEQVAPPEPVRKPEPPPAPAPPKMALPPEKPLEKQRPKPETRPDPEAPARATPSTGAQVIQGSTPVETRARGTGFGSGLSSTGGGSGASVTLDTSDFCCNEYLTAMIATIKRNWNPDQGARGTTTMKFTIRRDGTLDSIDVEQTSGSAVLDRAAQRALGLTTLQPLPDRYTNPTLTVHFRFQYEP